MKGLQKVANITGVGNVFFVNNMGYRMMGPQKVANWARVGPVFSVQHLLHSGTPTKSS